jgi:hypothetical protein
VEHPAYRGCLELVDHRLPGLSPAERWAVLGDNNPPDPAMGALLMDVASSSSDQPDRLGMLSSRFVYARSPTNVMFRFAKRLDR